MCNSFATADTITLQFSNANFPQQQLTTGSLHQMADYTVFRKSDTFVFPYISHSFGANFMKLSANILK